MQPVHCLRNNRLTGWEKAGGREVVVRVRREGVMDGRKRKIKERKDKRKEGRKE